MTWIAQKNILLIYLQQTGIVVVTISTVTATTAIVALTIHIVVTIENVAITILLC